MGSELEISKEVNFEEKSEGENILGRNLKTLLLSGQNSDTTIHVKGREFKVHRSILSVHSPEFELMINQNMSKNNCALINIDDCDPEIFYDFLLYLYIGKVDHVMSHNAPDLYKIAHKYKTTELKKWCALCMKNGLSVDSFCDIVVLASVYQESDLLNTAIKFFNENFSEIFPTSKWLMLLSKEPALSNKLLTSMENYAKNRSKAENLIKTVPGKIIPIMPKYLFTYCPSCNLCCPDDENTIARFDHPLYLGRLQLIPDFMSEEEETASISEIDKIEWESWQSGRRRQNFGPEFKENFVKVGEFKGFPKFTENILKKLKNISNLSDFRAVNLTHLEYTPERCSSIEPHVDDYWLWGERIITVSLKSSTVLTLLPFPGDMCKCSQEYHKYFSELYACSRKIEKGTQCGHKLYSNSSLNSSLSHLPQHCNLTSENPELKLNKHESNKNLLHCDQVNLDTCSESNQKLPTFINDGVINEGIEQNECDMCSVFRSGTLHTQIAVRVVLPPRCLFILGGCARYNWCHGIKRKDIVSRRLVIIFRELSPEFLEGGKREKTGEQLLSIARNFCDFY